MPKILVVDDEGSFIGIMQAFLRNYGHEVITAGDGREGLEKARSEHPDLILLDVVMPIMNGYTMLRDLRADERIRDTPVIMCTGKAQKEFVKATQGMDVEAYVMKPIDLISFLDTVEKILKNKNK